MRTLTWLMLAVTGCASCAAPIAEVRNGSPPELGSSLNVRVVDDSVRLEIHVTNVTSSPIVLEFMTTQRYDFEVSTMAGEPVWRWSGERAFGEALGRESLEPGESQRFSAVWQGGGRVGDYVATGRIVATNYPVELRTSFRIPSE